MAGIAWPNGIATLTARACFSVGRRPRTPGGSGWVRDAWHRWTMPGGGTFRHNQTPTVLFDKTENTIERGVFR
jgi:hypothetical protein